jgi:hypothetical protein
MSADQSYTAELEFVIGQVWLDGERHSETAEDGTEVYAYLHADGVAWGVNRAGDGCNVRRGIRTPQGVDIAVS